MRARRIDRDLVPLMLVVLVVLALTLGVGTCGPLGTAYSRSTLEGLMSAPLFVEPLFIAPAGEVDPFEDRREATMIVGRLVWQASEPGLLRVPEGPSGVQRVMVSAEPGRLREAAGALLNGRRIVAALSDWDRDVYDLGVVLELGPRPRFLPACRYADYTDELRGRLEDESPASVERFLVSVNETDLRRRDTDHPLVERPEDAIRDRYIRAGRRSAGER